MCLLQAIRLTRWPINQGQRADLQQPRRLQQQQSTDSLAHAYVACQGVACQGSAVAPTLVGCACTRGLAPGAQRLHDAQPQFWRQAEDGSWSSHSDVLYLWQPVYVGCLRTYARGAASKTLTNTWFCVRRWCAYVELRLPRVEGFCKARRVFMYLLSTDSLNIHLKSCKKMFEAHEAKKPAHLRRKVPEAPAAFDALASGKSGHHAFSEEAIQAANEEAYRKAQAVRVCMGQGAHC